MSIETPVPEWPPRRRPGRRRTLVVLTAAAVAVSLTGAAWAAVPDGETNAIHGCYSQDGALRVIDPSSSDRKLRECTSKETAITWNQEGPSGEAGLPGADGAQGVQGPAGPQGEPGPGLLSGYERYERSFDLPDGGTEFLDVTCPNDKVVISGGYANFGGQVFENRVTTDHSWRVTARPGPNGGRITVFLICIDGPA